MKQIPGEHPLFVGWFEEVTYLEQYLLEKDTPLLEVISMRGPRARKAHSLLRICQLEEHPNMVYRYLSEAVKLTPKEPIVNLLYGIHETDPLKSLMAQRRALEYSYRHGLQEIHLEAGFRYAHALHRCGKTAQAIQVFPEFLSIDPKDERGYRHLYSLVLLSGNEIELCEQYFSEENPDRSVHHLMNRAYYLLKFKQDTKAASELLQEVRFANNMLLKMLTKNFPVEKYSGRYWISGRWSEAMCYIKYFGFLWYEFPMDDLKRLLWFR